MATAIFISSEGEQHSVDVALNDNLMMAAIYSNLDGIEGMCGGCLACATCHVYVDPQWLDRLTPMGEDEDTLLTQVASERRPNSRLSCQIEMTPELSGITVHLPASQ